MTRKLCGVVLLAGLQGAVLAQDQWMNLQDQYWTVGLNWLDNSIPTNGEVVAFNSLASGASTDLGTNFTVQAVTVTDVGVPVSISNHTLTVLDGGLDLSGAAQDLEIASFLNVATAQTWNVQAGRTLLVAGRVSGNGAPTKQGAGTLVMRGNDLRTAGTTLAAGETVISGGVFNSTVTLAPGPRWSHAAGRGWWASTTASGPPPTTSTHWPRSRRTSPPSTRWCCTTSRAWAAALTSAPARPPPTSRPACRPRTSRSAGAARSRRRRRGPTPSRPRATTGPCYGSTAPTWCSTTTSRGSRCAPAPSAWMRACIPLRSPFTRAGGDRGFYANFATPGGPTNRITLADVATGPALRMLAADPTSVITVDETLLTFAPTSTLTIATPVGGSGGLRKIGTAGLILSATNSFGGGLYLYGGTVTVAQAESLGAATSGLDLRAGTLRFTGTTPADLDGRALNEETVASAFDLANAAHTLTVTSVLRGASALTKLGPGALQLSSMHTLSGAVTVAAGTLHLKGSGALLNATNLVVNGTLALDQGSSLNDTAVLRLGGLAGGRVVISNAAAEAVDRFIVDGILQASGTWGATGSGATHVNDTWFGGDGVLAVAVGYDGAVADGSWSTNANGTWSDTNNWVGQVYAQGTNQTAFFTNALTADRTVTEDFPTPLPLGQLVFGSPTNNWTVNGGSLELAVAAGAPTATVLTNTATVGTTLVGTQGLTKAGAGTLALTSATNRYSGTTTVDAGTLSLTGAGSLYSGGTSSGAIVVNNGGTLNFGRTDVWGIHTAVPLPSLTIQAGGLVQNNGAFFNTLGPVALNGRGTADGRRRERAATMRGRSAARCRWRGRCRVADHRDLKTTNGNVQIPGGQQHAGRRDDASRWRTSPATRRPTCWCRAVSRTAGLADRRLGRRWPARSSRRGRAPYWPAGTI
jgi:autotransporter-associated beta strand protein